MTAAATAAARGVDTPMMRTVLDVLAHLPVDNDNDNKFANAGGGRGGVGEVAGGPAAG